MLLFSYYKVSFFIVNERKNLHSGADNKRHEVINFYQIHECSCPVCYSLSPPPAHFTYFSHDVFYFSLLYQHGNFSYTGWSSKTFNENLWVSDNESLSPRSVKSDLLLHCIELHSQNTNMCTITEHNGSHTIIESLLRLSHYVYDRNR